LLRNHYDYDLILLDIKLPDGTGYDLCSTVRNISDVPIIFLTSCDDEESVTKGLNLGADNYITKPFRAIELIARINANLRRRNGNTETFVSNGDLVINLQAHEVKKQGKAINLTPIDYELLSILCKNQGIIVKRELILEKLWDIKGSFVENNTLTVAISRLKNKLGTNPANNEPYIETIRGYGYRWVMVKENSIVK
jgi:DNA-binding response OmpR family regulator